MVKHRILSQLSYCTLLLLLLGFYTDGFGMMTDEFRYTFFGNTLRIKVTVSILKCLFATVKSIITRTRD